MGFINIIGCCCGGPGLVKLRTSASDISIAAFAGGVRPVNPEFDLETNAGPSKRWPCWTTAFYDLGTPYAGEAIGGPLKALIAESDDVLAEHYIYYHTTRRSLINARSAVNVRELQLEQHCRIAVDTDVVDYLFNDGGGASPNIELVSAVDGQAIIDDTYEGTPLRKHGAFAGATNDRLIGFTLAEYEADRSNYKFKVWSVAYDGTDFVDEFNISGDVDDDDPRVPVNLTVVEGDVWCCGSESVSPGDLVIYKNGAIEATMDRPAAERFDPLLYNAVTAIGAGKQAFVASSIPTFAGGELWLSIVEDGVALEDNRVRLITYLAAAEDDVEFWPQAVSWDPEKRCAVVLWSNGDWGGFITYITEEITTGNIVGQAGVLIYGAFGSCGYDLGNSLAGRAGVGGTFGGPVYPNPWAWAVVIPGRMPQPLEIDGTDIVLPPPEPPSPDCDYIADCSADPSARSFINGFENYTEEEPPEVMADATTIGDMHTEWFLENLNLPIDLPYIAGSYQYEIEVGTVGDYGDPGILYRRSTATDLGTYPAPDNQRENYITKILMAVTCSDGLITLDSVTFSQQEFLGTLVTPWPTAYGSGDLAFGGEVLFTGEVFQLCFSTGAASNFPFEKFTNAGDSGGSRRFVVGLQIGLDT